MFNNLLRPGIEPMTSELKSSDSTLTTYPWVQFIFMLTLRPTPIDLEKTTIDFE